MNHMRRKNERSPRPTKRVINVTVHVTKRSRFENFLCWTLLPLSRNGFIGVGTTFMLLWEDIKRGGLCGCDP